MDDDGAVTGPTEQAPTPKPGPFMRLAATSILVAVVIVGMSFIGSRQSPLAKLIPSSCVVGLSGAAVSVQLDGPGATGACDKWAATSVTDDGTWYVYTSSVAPGGAVICQVDWRRQGIIYTVRDQGFLNAYGSGICESLVEPSPSQ